MNDFQTDVEKAADDWNQESLRKRELQPFEDYYKAIRAFEAGASFGRERGFQEAIDVLTKAHPVSAGWLSVQWQNIKQELK